MIQNNNTKDVAYLGFSNSPIGKDEIYKIATSTKSNCPKNMDYMFSCAELFFDCSGTRYGFRIKELKSK